MYCRHQQYLCEGIIDTIHNKTLLHLVYVRIWNSDQQHDFEL